MLIVYALINRETMLDLQPGRSVVQNLLKEGVDLYMIDWGYPTRKDRYLTIDDHVNGYMNNVVDFICERHGIYQINLMGICMGGTFSIMYAALHPEKIKNLITTVTPSNFDTNSGLLHVWTKEMNFTHLVDAYGNVPGDLLNLGFLLLNPARLVIDKYKGYFENIHNKELTENFIRMEKWIFDSPDVPGETILQFIEDCYQKNLLIQSKMELAGELVDLAKITMPLLNIYGKYDHLVPPEACELLTEQSRQQGHREHVPRYRAYRDLCQLEVPERVDSQDCQMARKERLKGYRTSVTRRSATRRSATRRSVTRRSVTRRSVTRRKAIRKLPNKWNATSPQEPPAQMKPVAQNQAASTPRNRKNPMVKKSRKSPKRHRQSGPDLK